MGSLRLYMLLLLVAVAPRAYAQSPCADGARPVCSDGSEAAPCSDGPPTCADGTVIGAPDDAPSGGSGSATATGCSPTTCTADGNSNYVLRRCVPVRVRARVAAVAGGRTPVSPSALVLSTRMVLSHHGGALCVVTCVVEAFPHTRSLTLADYSVTGN
jgi:hypothetical protein